MSCRKQKIFTKSILTIWAHYDSNETNKGEVLCIKTSSASQQLSQEILIEDFQADAVVENQLEFREIKNYFHSLAP